MTSLEEAQARPLVDLPGQPDGVPWPTDEWPTGDPPDSVAGPLAALVDEAFDDEGPLAKTHAVLVVQHGRIVAERYRDGKFGPSSRMRSWSMSKSFLHAIVGMLVEDGKLDVTETTDVLAWQGDGDPRGAITLDHLLTMRDGLDFLEDYDLESKRSDVIDMLFGKGMGDVAAYAADRPLAHDPDTHFNYSSGTSNIVAGIAGRAAGGRPGIEQIYADRLARPIGLRTAFPAFDDAGTWVGSTYCDGTARDFARFGYLYLRGGTWDGQQVVSREWVDYARAPRSIDPNDGRMYGSHWWVVGDELGTFWANGYEGQSILVCPALDLLLVRCGQTDKDFYPQLADWRARIITAFT